MYPRCSTCEHSWLGDSGTYCTLASSQYGNPNIKTSLSTAIDHEHYLASLQVHPTFGCVQHSDISDVQHILKDR